MFGDLEIKCQHDTEHNEKHLSEQRNSTFPVMVRLYITGELKEGCAMILQVAVYRISKNAL